MYRFELRLENLTSKSPVERLRVLEKHLNEKHDQIEPNVIKVPGVNVCENIWPEGLVSAIKLYLVGHNDGVVSRVKNNLSGLFDKFVIYKFQFDALNFVYYINNLSLEEVECLQKRFMLLYENFENLEEHVKKNMKPVLEEWDKLIGGGKHLHLFTDEKFLLTCRILEESQETGEMQCDAF